MATLILAAAIVSPPAARAGSPRPLAASDIKIGVAPAMEVLSLWEDGAPASAKDRRRAVTRIATSAPYRLLRQFQGYQNRCLITDEDFTRALLYPESTACGLSFFQARGERASIDSLLRAVVAREPALRAQIASEVSRYVPESARWGDVRIWFVISSRWTFDASTQRWEDPRDGDEPI
ncbi:MAG: hypothetical protein ACM3JJ_06525, partial [Hyphomicrobiales bacterium]